jgi:DNA processing protein
MQQSSLLYQIALNRIPQVGMVTARQLIAFCGGAREVFHAKRQDLLKIPGVGPGIVEAILSKEALLEAEKELHFITRNHIQTLFYTDPLFPSRLKNLRDAPIMLYFKGSDVRLLDAPRMLAVVGTRKITEQGVAICESIVEGLKPYEVVLVSGLAYGVDITAHRKACLLGVPNIGVLGHGLGSIYPAAHKSTAARMLENGGLLTEYMHNEGPDREHFPMRNRIISGLCDALLVVETGATGGSMISVEFALKHHLEVFAVPGRPTDPQSSGCNQLIKSNRARLIVSAADIVEVMNWDVAGSPRGVQGRLFEELSEEEARIMDAVRSTPKIGIDDLGSAVSLQAGELASIILQLEFRGLLRTFPGKRYSAL